MEKSRDSKYIQQHLANERTFLAWIRTGIAVIGLGFLASGIVIRSTSFAEVIHEIAAYTGIGAVALGAAVILLATFDYYEKRKGINDENFLSSGRTVLFVSAAMSVISLSLIALIIVLTAAS